jgi:oxygen-independent coproporphyrinogen-3 oxidase
VAGIYIHTPFCKRKCAYCDFYSVANNTMQDEFTKALLKEIELKKNYFSEESVQTIYFGGGTPSMLKVKDLENILNQLKKYYSVAEENEITLEANPDDLSLEYLKTIKKLGVNRLSIGIQSFIERDLKVMKRQHTVNQAIKAVEQAQNAGFKNISIDLIYGLPDLTNQEWEQNVQNAIDLNIQHISAYHLTIEPGTLFYKFNENGKLNLPDENESINQFKLLQEKLAQYGFVHYEISNFAKDGFLSLHNTNYWMNVKYLGLGPSAHSFDLTSREWNISNLRVYINEILKGKLPIESEKLSTNEKYNDYILTSLRTMWGLNTEIIKKEFGKDYEIFFLRNSKKYLDKNLIIQNNHQFKLTDKGIFISDHIISNLLWV